MPNPHDAANPELEQELEKIMTCHIKGCGFYDEKTGEHGAEKCFAHQISQAAALITQREAQEYQRGRVDELDFVTDYLQEKGLDWNWLNSRLKELEKGQKE